MPHTHLCHEQEVKSDIAKTIVEIMIRLASEKVSKKFCNYVDPYELQQSLLEDFEQEDICELKDELIYKLADHVDLAYSDQVAEIAMQLSNINI